ncbi:MAG: hypothetical protein ABI323_11875 [Solirubrobacteraceae bacterium]
MSAEQDLPPATSSSSDPESDAEGGSSAVSPAVGSEVESPDAPAAPVAPETTERDEHPRSRNMLPGRDRRRFGIERVFVRLIATGGIIGIGVAIAAIMVSSKSQSWIIGLVVSGVSVVLSAILWSSRSV